MAVSQYRMFFDTSAYIAGLISPKGAAGELIRLVEANILRMVVSQQVIVEADRVVAYNNWDTLNYLSRKKRFRFNSMCPNYLSIPII